MTILPNEAELQEMGIYLWCPDCGEWLWDSHERLWISACTCCGWPVPDVIVEGNQ